MKNNHIFLILTIIGLMAFLDIHGRSDKTEGSWSETRSSVNLYQSHPPKNRVLALSGHHCQISSRTTDIFSQLAQQSAKLPPQNLTGGVGRKTHVLDS